MAARRERDRRRPSERRYSFGSPGAPPDATVDDAALLETEELAETSLADGPARTRQVREATPAQRAARMHQPFSMYRAEYGYVVGDLQRVALVVGSLLLILIVLYLVLPH
jgi:hypothetical protein